MKKLLNDIYIKDEGDFATVHFVTQKAQRTILKSIDKPLPMHFSIAPEEAFKILSWAITHDLTIDSEISIKIPTNLQS